MAYSVKWLTSKEASIGRLARLTEGQEYPDLNHKYVLHVELNGNMENPDRFQETDADNINHALTLAKQWVTVHGVTSVAIRKVEKDGDVGAPDIYDWGDFQEFDLYEEEAV